MLSARELAPERNPQAGSWVNQRIVFTHGFGIAMVPVNEVDPPGPAAVLHPRPAAAVGARGAAGHRSRGSTSASGPSDWVVVGARQPEFDYPIGTGDGTDGSGSQEDHALGGRDRHQAGQHPVPAPLRRPLPRPQPADLGPGDGRQPAAHAPHARRAARRIAPFLAYDKDPYSVVNDEGRLVWIQDAYTLTDRFPNAQAFNGSVARGRQRPGRPLSSTTCATASRSSWTPTTAR